MHNKALLPWMLRFEVDVMTGLDLYKIFYLGSLIIIIDPFFYYQL